MMKLLILLFAGLVIIGSVWFAIAQWSECRDMGFSIFYCLKHIA